VFRKLELFANASIVVVAVILGYVLVTKYVLPRRPPAVATIVPGTPISLPAVDWKDNHRTLLVALRQGCHFCEESAPFYQRVVREASQRDVRVIALLSQPTSGARLYLESIAVPIRDVRDVELKALNVSLVPTLILADDQGRVTGVWQGKLDTTGEASLFAALN
jgi:hypothetical protein